MNNSVANTARLLGAGLRALLVLTVLCGVLYPLAVTGAAQALFHDKANGSEIKADGRTVGSELIGQRYDLPLRKGQRTPEPDLRWFQPRPSNGLGENSVNTQHELLLSGATNLSGDSKELIAQVKAAKEAVIKDNSTASHKVSPSEVPADAVTSSGSGLDPHISPSYADLQVHRVAERNHVSVARVQTLVDDNTEGRTLGFMGEPRVNVLRLNIALKELTAGDGDS
ncbi:MULTISPECIES: potassium-transporting ATPase subunit C [Streptomyces]|uniref:potassium-transporting ATPase subunit C n=1 Tax=Streptomyces TaxID=1883 RepID=UPI001E465696|nr:MULTISPECIES: potassium-transporting ATPase subunit C [Streptomyces]UFQ14704.1 potassium-transporting ATPase subunit C [Streptomyces huasconensis]WCL84306.1 potassium-transporting ATPase subunit C [Streptomyces sp. JCM 35825]